MMMMIGLESFQDDLTGFPTEEKRLQDMNGFVLAGGSRPIYTYAARCSVLFCSVLFCSVLFCSVLFCSVLVLSLSGLSGGSNGGRPAGYRRDLFWESDGHADRLAV
jgi:hypothetical protein